MTQFTREKFEEFLCSIKLKEYRERFRSIKTVEMDLPRNIQALDIIYKEYWDNKNERETPLSFDDFYDEYLNAYKDQIGIFKAGTGFGMNCCCFELGLKARIYRTWASLITQIQAGYVARGIFKEVRMSTELDHKGIDILAIKENGDEIKIQVKKITKRPEIARMIGHDGKNSGDIITLEYFVPNDFDKPTYVKDGKPKPWVQDFLDTGVLKRLSNGFVIFRNKFFDGI